MGRARRWDRVEPGALRRLFHVSRDRAAAVECSPTGRDRVEAQGAAAVGCFTFRVTAPRSLCCVRRWDFDRIGSSPGAAAAGCTGMGASARVSHRSCAAHSRRTNSSSDRFQSTILRPRKFRNSKSPQYDPIQDSNENGRRPSVSGRGNEDLRFDRLKFIALLRACSDPDRCFFA
jgi:hypothetical protein